MFRAVLAQTEVSGREEKGGDGGRTRGAGASSSMNIHRGGKWPQWLLCFSQTLTFEVGPCLCLRSAFQLQAGLVGDKAAVTGDRV